MVIIHNVQKICYKTVYPNYDLQYKIFYHDTSFRDLKNNNPNL